MRRAADDVLALNQDAIVRKNDRMQRSAAATSTLLLVLSILATGAGVR